MAPGTAAAHHPDAYDKDPFDQAPPPAYWGGLLTIETFDGFFVTGGGSTPYVEAIHGDRKHYTIIRLMLTHINPAEPIKERGTVPWSKEFMEVIRPSLEALVPKMADLRNISVTNAGADKNGNPIWLRSDNGKRFIVSTEASGLWYLGENAPQPDKPQYPTWKFTAVFGTQDECQAAWIALQQEQGFSAPTTPQFDNTAYRPRVGPQIIAPPKSANGFTKAQADTFLELIYSAHASGTMNEFTEAAIKHPAITAHYSYMSLESYWRAHHPEDDPADDIPF